VSLVSGLEIVVGRYPPGTGKWNKIEHRMFSFISINWKGEPLVSFETVVKMIGAQKTQHGLKIKAVPDKSRYETGLKISPQQMKELNIEPQCHLGYFDSIQRKVRHFGVSRKKGSRQGGAAILSIVCLVRSPRQIETTCSRRNGNYRNR
jgi:hypothetical protein